MSSVDDDMMRDILIHFKKDKDVAEKHQRKIQEIRESKKRAERKAVEDQLEAPPRTAADAAGEGAGAGRTGGHGDRAGSRGRRGHSC